MSFPKRLALLPIFLFIISIIALLAWDIKYIFEPPLLLLILNTLFISVVAFFVSYIAAVGYIRTGLRNLLLLGCGVLSLGLASLAAGWLRVWPDGANLNVTVFNISVLISGSFHLLGTSLILEQILVYTLPGSRTLKAFLAYALVLLFIVLLAVVTLQGLLPRFFIPGQGPTLVRQGILGLAILLFGLSAFMVLRLHARSQSGLLYWYGLGLVLLAIGFSAVWLLKDVGIPLNWVGRTAQYAAGVYLLIAVLIALRNPDAALEWAIADFFREAATNYRALVQVATDAIFAFDHTGRLLLWNPAAGKVFGYHRGEAVGASLIELLIPEKDVAAWQSEIDHLIGAGESKLTGRVVNVEMRRKNGQIFPAELTLSISKMGRGWRATGIVRDVTEQVQARQQLRQYADRLETLREIDQAILLARSPEEIAQAALEHISGLLVAVRAAAVVVFDLEADEATTLAVWIEGCFGSEAGARYPLANLEQFDRLHRGETLIIRDGAPFSHPFPPYFQPDPSYSTLAIPLLYRHELVGALSLAVDEPAEFSRSQAEIAREMADQLAIAVRQAYLHAQIQRHATELEQRVATRTAELNSHLAEIEQLNQSLTLLLEELQLSNTNLAQTTDKLKEANAELESFSYSVSHNLRAPLRALDGFARILLEEYAPQFSSEAVRYLNLLRINAQQMDLLINDLLTFSRLSRQPLKKETVVLTTLARDVLRQLKHLREGRNIEIVLDELPPCQADPTLMRQVLLNLLENALKFTRHREKARIEISYHDSDGETVYSIKDNGVGFDMRYVHKLFGVFQRLHRAEEYEGTGVGLATTQRILRRHGGRIWAEAAVNQGAKFYFSAGKDNELAGEEE